MVTFQTICMKHANFTILCIIVVLNKAETCFQNYFYILLIYLKVILKKVQFSANKNQYSFDEHSNTINNTKEKRIGQILFELFWEKERERSNSRVGIIKTNKHLLWEWKWNFLQGTQCNEITQLRNWTEFKIFPAIDISKCNLLSKCSPFSVCSWLTAIL